ncbi:UDP-N-acetylmuramate-alanine ligase, partial [Snodgrassella alvi SCGC AB-598-J21]
MSGFLSCSLTALTVTLRYKQIDLLIEKTPLSLTGLFDNRYMVYKDCCIAHERKARASLTRVVELGEFSKTMVTGWFCTLVNSTIDRPASRIYPFFVIEADEYDTAFFDKRSKFVHYRPRTAILNNLEYDHADIFPNLAAIQTQFHHLIRTIPSEGLIVVNEQSAALDEVLQQGCWSEVEGFGLNKDWQIGEISASGGFDVLYQQQKVGHIEWKLLGQHNRMNALAVIAAARHAGVSIRQSCAALSRFENVKRRMEVKGVVNDITVYDDFAHHPTAIATTIAGLRQKVANARILAVLEPRSNTMKLGTMKAA